MPWYGMHLIDRVRNQATETERAQGRSNHGRHEPPSRTALVLEAAPTLAIVALWAMICAVLYCAATGTREWDIILTVAIGPLAMVVAGIGWGSQKGRLTSGLDAAIVTGTIVGGLLAVGALV